MAVVLPQQDGSCGNEEKSWDSGYMSGFTEKMDTGHKK